MPILVGTLSIKSPSYEREGLLWRLGGSQWGNGTRHKGAVRVGGMGSEGLVKVVPNGSGVAGSIILGWMAGE